MFPKYDALLCKRHPALFAERYLSTSVAPMAWGFTCEDGWFDLIDELCRKLQQVVEAGRLPQPIATQVKEKFETLRFYLSASNAEVQRLVEEAERRSAVTCEVCGRPGNLRHPSGVRTLCDVHGGDWPVLDPMINLK